MKNIKQLILLIPKKIFWPALCVAISLTLAMGCKVQSSNWVDKMLEEMEAAWVRADNANLGQEARDAAVSTVAQKYFKPGMSKEEAFTLLRQLKSNGFEIRESRHDGARTWPDGAFSTWESAPYSDKATIRNIKLQFPEGISHYSAGKMYGEVQLIIKKTASITFKVVDGMDVIGDTEAVLYADSI